MFEVKACSKDKYHIYYYIGSGTANVVESNQQWNTIQEAQEAADRANSGDKTGLSFGMYSDD